MQVFTKPILILFALVGRVFQYKCKQYLNLGQSTKLVQARWIGYINLRVPEAETLCIKECFQRRKCKGIKIEVLENQCRLIEDDGSNALATPISITDIEMWSPGIVGTCAPRPCPHNMKCLPTTPNYTCVPYCDMFNNIIWTPHMENIKGIEYTSIGAYYGTVETWTIRCIPTYMRERKLFKAKCMEDSTWTHDIPICIEIQTCEQIRNCRSSYSDGLYKVHSGGNVVTVNCTNMKSLTPKTNKSVLTYGEAIAPHCEW